MTIPFSKFHGTGNDFIMIDGRAANISAIGIRVADLCSRRTGIGADGLILLTNATDADFRMVYFNADGKEATMCGNGGRAVAAFANRLGIVTNSSRFMASDGLHQATIDITGHHGYYVKLSMTDVNGISHETEGMKLNTGVPHLVVFTNNVSSIDAVDKGRKLRNLTKFQPEGVNVNFAELTPEGIIVRTYERGVEDETLSCGTGITATVLAHAANTGTTQGKTDVFCRGGNLSVSYNRQGDLFTDVMLNGPAMHVFDGTIEI